MARSLAKELGRTVYEIKQGDDDGRNMKSEARMVGIQVCNGQEDPATMRRFTFKLEFGYLGDSVTNLDRIAALKEECGVKKDGDHSTPIGFAA